MRSICQYMNGQYIYIHTHMGYRASLGAQLVKNPLAMQETWVRSPGEGKGPLQFGLENSMGCIVHEVAKSWTRLSDFHFHMGNMYICVIYFIFLVFSPEEEKATHSSVLAWRIPGTGEPGGLPSVGSHRVRHD